MSSSGDGTTERPGAWADTETRLAAAVFGFALGVVLSPFVNRPAPPGQLPGYAVTTLHLDARSPFWFVLELSLLTIAMPFLLRPLLRRLAAGRAWARHGVTMAAAVSLWSALLDHSLWRCIVPFAIVLAFCTILRNVDVHFTRRDLILLPAGLSVAIALIDVAYFMTLQADLIVTALALLGIRFVLTFLPRRDVDPSVSFALAPLGLFLESEILSYHQRHLGWPALFLALVTPFLLRPLIRNPLSWRKAIAWVVFPVAAYGFSMSISISGAEGKQRASFFEDQHGLMPAEQMLHGKKPWRDFVPAHGFVEDGLLDYVALVTHRNPNIGHALRVRAILGNLTSVAIYALGAAASGSAEVGFFAYLLALMYGSATMPFRVVPALFALACTVGAARTRRPRWFAVAGFILVLAVTSGLEFATYSGVTLIVALLRYGPDRPRAVRETAIGVAAAAVPLGVVLLFSGILPAFLHTTLIEIPSMSTAYAIDTFGLPDAFNRFSHIPDVLLLLVDKGVFHYILWPILAVFAATMLAARRRRAIEPLLLLGIWAVAASLSYAERHHMYFHFVVGPFIAGLTFLAFRLHSRWAPAVVVILMAVGSPTFMWANIGMLRRAHWPLEQVSLISDPPRAQGAYWMPYYAYVTAYAKRYVDTLPPGDTFFDFTNRGILYFLFDRVPPVRQTEVAYYESESLQRQVIDAIEHNPHVVAALVPPPQNDQTGVDGVPNPVRAPLVWKYLQTHFHPDFADGPVVFWRRNGAVVASPQ